MNQQEIIDELRFIEDVLAYHNSRKEYLKTQLGKFNLGMDVVLNALAPYPHLLGRAEFFVDQMKDLKADDSNYFTVLTLMKQLSIHEGKQSVPTKELAKLITSYRELTTGMTTSL
jgi:hypothetical protein